MSTTPIGQTASTNAASATTDATKKVTVARCSFVDLDNTNTVIVSGTVQEHTIRENVFEWGSASTQHDVSVIYSHPLGKQYAGAWIQDNQFRALTTYDSASVMHYPQCNGTSATLAFTQRDQQGVGQARAHALLPAVQARPCVAVRAKGGRVVAVGTTSLRLLESAAKPDGTIEAFEGDTAIFISPGYRFRAVDMLMTNFHLPRSTLFMLVSAFSGLDTMKAAYAHAIATGYRFYSFGDASLLFPAPAHSAT